MKNRIHRSVHVGIALSAGLAATAVAQTGGTATNGTSSSRYVCRVTPVKNTASDTAYTIRTDSAVADSTRLAVNGATVRCRAANARRGNGSSGSSTSSTGTPVTSGGDVSLAPRRVASSTRIPVTKEPVRAPEPVAETPQPAPVPTPTPEPTPVPVAVESSTPAPAPTPEPSPAPMVVKHYGNGFYIGIGGGAGIPTEALREAYDPGATVVVPMGWDSQTGPLGLRLNLGYTNLDSRRTFRSTGLATGGGFGTTTTSFVATENPQIWSAMGDLKLRWPFSGYFDGARSGLYVVGGGGVNYFRHYNTTFAMTNPEFNTGTSVTSTSESMTRFAANAGAGLSWGLGMTEVFLESRYVTTFTEGRRASYVPITLGLTFR